MEVSKPAAGTGAAALRRPFKLNAHQESASWKKREERHKKELERYEKQLKEVRLFSELNVKKKKTMWVENRLMGCIG